MTSRSKTSSPGPASNYYNRNDGNDEPGSIFFRKIIILSSNLRQVAEEAGKQGFWDKLRNTFVRE